MPTRPIKYSFDKCLNMLKKSVQYIKSKLSKIIQVANILLGPVRSHTPLHFATRKITYDWNV